MILDCHFVTLRLQKYKNYPKPVQDWGLFFEKLNENLYV